MESGPSNVRLFYDPIICLDFLWYKVLDPNSHSFICVCCRWSQGLFTRSTVNVCVGQESLVSQNSPISLSDRILVPQITLLSFLFLILILRYRTFSIGEIEH